MGPRTLLLGLVTMFLLPLFACPASAPNKSKPAGGEILERFLGQWDTEARIRRLVPTTRELKTRGKGTCTKTLEGRFVEFRTTTIPPGDSELQVMTFDEKTDRFVQWVFSSDGYRHEAKGTWDPATSTLTWIGEADGTSFVIEDRFVGDQLVWTLRRKNSEGTEIQTIDGRLQRARGP